VRRESSRARFRPFAVVGAAVVMTLAAAVPASAHTPVRLDSTDMVPWVSPLILDGQSPVMLFGVFPRARAVRSAQLHMQAGQQLIVTLAIPDQAPENQLATGDLPTVLVVAPDLKLTRVVATLRIHIQLEGGLNVVLLHTYATTAISGNYSIIVTGCVPARFAVATGIEGLPFGGIERGTVATDDEVLQWYNTPPASSPSSTHWLSSGHSPV
jgi:hypothetical protein